MTLSKFTSLPGWRGGGVARKCSSAVRIVVQQEQSRENKDKGSRTTLFTNLGGKLSSAGAGLLQRSYREVIMSCLNLIQKKKLLAMWFPKGKKEIKGHK